MLEKYEGILQIMMEPNDEAANWGGLFFLVVVLGLNLLLLLGSRLRLLNCWRGRIPFLRFLFFREPQPTLRHLENDGAVPFEGDFAREV
jgi:hypothetical protein